MKRVRIIAGQFRSRKLVAPDGLKTRPTSDRLRETLFNVLQPRIGGAVFADLYAGSGAVGLEALSRGAKHVHFAENAKPPLVALRENAGSLGLKEGVDHTVHMRGVEAALSAMAAAGTKLDLVFLDPPYEAMAELSAALGLLATLPVLAAGAVVIAEHSRKQSPPESLEALARYRLLRQGDAALSFYAMQADSG
jgi:16S rRNA (guanine(966)-N(2))-methyltransferase RsmD